MDDRLSHFLPAPRKNREEGPGHGKKDAEDARQQKRQDRGALGDATHEEVRRGVSGEAAGEEDHGQV
jgi:hypothetical protein